MSADLSLSNLPLFPLTTVLFPDGYLPLQIFEVRYLHMVRGCQRTGAPFAIVPVAQASEVGGGVGSTASDTGGPHWMPVGTLAHLDACEPVRAGLLHIRCTGGARVRIDQPHQLPNGLWVGQALGMPTDAAVAVPADLTRVASALRRVVDKLLASGMDALQMPVQAPYAWNDCAWVANRWCELLPLPLPLKARLMALDNPLLRLELVSDLLEQQGIPT